MLWSLVQLGMCVCSSWFHCPAYFRLSYCCLSAGLFHCCHRGDLILWNTSDAKPKPRVVGGGHTRSVFSISFDRGVSGSAVTTSLDRSVRGVFTSHGCFLIPCEDYLLGYEQVQASVHPSVAGRLCVSYWYVSDRFATHLLLTLSAFLCARAYAVCSCHCGVDAQMFRLLTVTE